jgi:hypothetical protein
MTRETHGLDSQGRAKQQTATKHGKPLSALRECTCNQGPDGVLLVDPECPLHGHLHKRDADGKLVKDSSGRVPRVTTPRPGDVAAVK